MKKKSILKRLKKVRGKANLQLHNKPTIGLGIYTPPDISIILQIPQKRIRRYINDVWDDRFGKKKFNATYSWNLRNHRAVNFLVLIEFQVVRWLIEAGIPTKRIFKARNAIAQAQHLAYPFASSKLRYNAKNIWYQVAGSTIDANETHQLNFTEFVEEYTKCIDYGSDNLAKRLYPRGRNNSIIVDPHHQFGSPIIKGTNINAKTIYEMHRSGDSIEVLSTLYNLEEKHVWDAINFFGSKRAA